MRILVVFVCFISLCGPYQTGAQTKAGVTNVSYQQNKGVKLESAELYISPVPLGESNQVIIVTPAEWSTLGDLLTNSIKDTFSFYEKKLGKINNIKTVVRIMDSDSFYASTKAPPWTNALFYKGQILIPIETNKKLDLENTVRSARHEFTHAIIHTLSGGNCPGWLDEGLAQLAEGEENPALRPAFTRWLRNNDPVPLALLKGGFTKLKNNMVAAAYAQSLVYSEFIINNYGYRKLGDYFRKLNVESSRETAFEDTFGESMIDYEDKMGVSVRDTNDNYEPSQVMASAKR